LENLLSDSASPRYKLNAMDWKSIGYGALDAVIGALITYATEVVGGIDFGPYSPTVMIAFTAGTKALRKFISAPKGVI
jgi:hypothetical protein